MSEWFAFTTVGRNRNEYTFASDRPPSRGKERRGGKGGQKPAPSEFLPQHSERLGVGTLALVICS